MFGKRHHGQYCNDNSCDGMKDQDCPGTTGYTSAHLHFPSNQYLSGGPGISSPTASQAKSRFNCHITLSRCRSKHHPWSYSIIPRFLSLLSAPYFPYTFKPGGHPSHPCAPTVIYSLLFCNSKPLNPVVSLFPSPWPAHFCLGNHTP